MENLEESNFQERLLTTRLQCSCICCPLDIERPIVNLAYVQALPYVDFVPRVYHSAYIKIASAEMFFNVSRETNSLVI
jgi:hypothetical protein